MENDLRCDQCQTRTRLLRHGMCARCVREYRLTGTWCEAHGPCWSEREGGCLVCLDDCSTCDGTGEIPARGHEAVAAGIATWPCPQCSDSDEDLLY